jgi:hypothetical protein
MMELFLQDACPGSYEQEQQPQEDKDAFSSPRQYERQNSIRKSPDKKKEISDELIKETQYKNIIDEFKNSLNPLKKQDMNEANTKINDDDA